MDGYRQARQVVSHKGVRAAGIPFLTQYQLGGVVFGLALGYGSGLFWVGFVTVMMAIIGLGVFRQELMAVRGWFLLITLIRNLIKRPLVIAFNEDNTPTDDARLR